MYLKPHVVLEHLRTPNSLPLLLGQDTKIKTRIFDDATELLNKVY
jgi:hypothetical protein